jgi:AraC-like DNA-binding protein
MVNINLSRMNRHRASAAAVFGDVLYPAGGALGPRVQQDYQLVIIYEGEAQVEVDGTAHAVPSQHALLLLPGHREVFQFARAQHSRHTWCAVAPQAVPAELGERAARMPACLPLTQRVHTLVEYGLALPPGPAEAAGHLLLAIGLAALEAFLFEAELAHQAQDVPEAVRRALHAMELHLAEPLDLRRIAEAASVTPQHLTRLFRRHLGTTPARHLWQLRTRRGVELLGETGLSIGAIAERSGFQSPFHFSRMVRRHYRRSPRELRALLWRGEAVA